MGFLQVTVRLFSGHGSSEGLAKCRPKQAFLSREPESWVYNIVWDSFFPWFPEKFSLLSLSHFPLMLDQIFSVIQFHEHLSIAFNAPLTMMDALKYHGRETGVSLQENRSLSHVFVSVGKSDAKEEVRRSYLYSRSFPPN